MTYPFGNDNKTGQIDDLNRVRKGKGIFGAIIAISNSILRYRKLYLQGKRGYLHLIKKYYVELTDRHIDTGLSLLKS